MEQGTVLYLKIFLNYMVDNYYYHMLILTYDNSNQKVYDMSIKYAILGFLSWKSATGYELKKLFEESSSMHWSGNNNQIYKTLLQIQDEGLVTNQLIHQDGLPSKKIYTITRDGLEELKEWVLSEPLAPEYKKSFLIQMAWSDQLNDKELDELLLKYENELKIQLLMHEEKTKRAQNVPNRTNRETILWDMISKNISSSYKNELNWILEVRSKLFKNADIKEENKLDYNVRKVNNKKYIELVSSSAPLSTEGSALDLIALCGEADTNLLMLNYSTLSEDFFKLKTGVAGKILQKFINYQIKAVVIMLGEIAQKGRFKELVTELNKSNHFRFYENRKEAEKWLIN